MVLPMRIPRISIVNCSSGGGIATPSPERSVLGEIRGSSVTILAAPEL